MSVEMIVLFVILVFAAVQLFEIARQLVFIHKILQFYFYKQYPNEKISDVYSQKFLNREINLNEK
mgnify:CR=1 FL=1